MFASILIAISVLLSSSVFAVTVSDPQLEVERRVIVCPKGHAPKVTRVGPRHLLVGARTGFARANSVSLVESLDNGLTWSAPRSVFDSPDNDRIQTLATLPGGDVLLGFVRKDLKDETARAYLMWSQDKGQSWSKPKLLDPAPFEWLFPYGRLFESSSGKLMMNAYGGYFPIYDDQAMPTEKRGYFSWLLESSDGGRSWAHAATIGRGTQTIVVRLASGKLLAAMRSAELEAHAQSKKLFKDANDYVRVPDHTLITTSTDEGRTWSSPRRVTDPAELQGYPVESSSGAVVMTYTVRHSPFGVAVLVSNDEGQTWGRPMSLVSDAPTADVGLSQTLELEPNRFLTFYYQDDQASENRRAEIVGVFWSLK